MMTIRTPVAVLCAVALLGGSSLALAEQPAKAKARAEAAHARAKLAVDRAEARHAVAKAKHADAKDKNEDKDEGKDKGKDKGKADDAHEKARNAIAEDRAALRDAGVKPGEAWRARRRARRQALIKKWGKPLLEHPAVRAELKVHAWRLARLARILYLANKAGKKDLVARVNKLLEKENARHEKHMAVLQKNPGQGAQK